MPDDPKTFAELIKQRLTALGYGGPRNADLTRLMERNEHPITREMSSAYMHGRHKPTGANLEAMLDALQLEGADRLRAYALCNGRTG